ncbi:uncharacterized protein BX663DRAFT_429044, partial [Cokeromyces recurvatus]|uniref:uncharacterized protein n=1 Tax=Cokeromyces recurvatus TaxID=90255 RepID=UPI00221E8196
SFRYTPNAIILQGSILLSFLYSYYINNLPALLRYTSILNTITKLLLTTIPSVNCLLHMYNVDQIAYKQTLQRLLYKCQQYSLQLGY